MIEKIREARKNIDPYITKTSVIFAEKISDKVGGEIYLKLENLQKAGSFKMRGAINKMLSLTDDEKKRGIIAASAGNHAQGVAFASQLLQVNATIVMPKHAPKSKVMMTKQYGANVILEGKTFDEAMIFAKKVQKEKNLTFVHPFDDDKIIAGQGTIGLEIIEDLVDVDQIIVPIGGGGLMAGVACAIKEINPSIKLIGVQTYKVSPMFNSFKSGELKKTIGTTTIADGIAVGTPAKRTFNIIKKYVDKIITVTEEEIAKSILFLLEKCKVVTEGAGAVSVAALFTGKINVKGKKTLSIISGGNIDVTSLEDIINNALINEGRRIELKVNIEDTPHKLVDLLEIVSKNNGNIYKVRQGKTRKNLGVNEQAVTLVVDTSGKDVSNKIIKEINDYGYKIVST